MSQDIASYWIPVQLTPLGRVVYEEDEVVLQQTTKPGIDIEDGIHVLQRAGHLHVTTHRLIWLQQESTAAAASAATHPSDHASQRVQVTALALPLEAVERVESKSFMLSFSTPRLHLFLHDPPTVEWFRRVRLATPRLGPTATRAAIEAGRAAAEANAGPKPAKSSAVRVTKLVFRGEGIQPYFQALESALKTAAFKLPPSSATVGGALGMRGLGANASASSASASSAVSSHPPSSTPSTSAFTTSSAGIGGIMRSAQNRSRAMERTIDEATRDLNTLMANAKTVVDLAARLAASRESNTSSSSSSSASVSSLLHDLGIGIANPVTRNEADSASPSAASEYYRNLAKEIAEFMPDKVEKQGGMLLLTDAYCLLNRARGTQLVSPQDLLSACSLLSSLPSHACTLRLRTLNGSGVQVLMASSAAEEQIMQRIKKEMEERAMELEKMEATGGAKDNMQLTVSDAVSDSTSRPSAASSLMPYLYRVSISPVSLSHRFHLSILLSKQYLCLAEERGMLCRDESRSGLRFYLNLFAP